MKVRGKWPLNNVEVAAHHRREDFALRRELDHTAPGLDKVLRERAGQQVRQRVAHGGTQRQQLQQWRQPAGDVTRGTGTTPTPLARGKIGAKSEHRDSRLLLREERRPALTTRPAEGGKVVGGRGERLRGCFPGEQNRNRRGSAGESVGPHSITGGGSWASHGRATAIDPSQGITGRRGIASSCRRWSG